MPETIQCLPTMGIIRAMVNRRLGLAAASSELVDNACDKGAKHIRLSVDRKLVCVEDDGMGVVDLPGMMIYGHHAVTMDEEPTIGRYGVCFKDAVIWLGRSLHVETRNNGQRRAVAVDWLELERNPVPWAITFGDKIEEPGQSSFTRISVSDIYNHRMDNARQLGERLAIRFSPGIISGIEIILNGDPLV